MENLPYRKIYINHYLSIRVFTNSKAILRLVNNFLDFNNIVNSKPQINIDFYLHEIDPKNKDYSRNWVCERWLDRNKNITMSMGNIITTVTANPKTGIVKGTIFNYNENFKERFLDLTFSQPLHFILAHHGLFFLHASAVCKKQDCILISGPPDSGKSTLALTLAQDGFRLVADDDCFVKVVRNQAQLFPFPTKIGLNKGLIKKYPELNKHVLKNYSYGGKFRLSLNSVFSNPNITKDHRCRIIIFPRYKKGGNICINSLSRQEALNRLAKENLTVYDRKVMPNLTKRNLETLSTLIKQARSFEIIYNDEKLKDIPEIISKIF